MQNTTTKEKRAKQSQYFNSNRVRYVDYKDVDVLEQFVDAHARIVPKHKTRVSARNQRLIASAIKRARFMALLPYVAK